VPGLTEAVTRTFALGEASRLQSLFAEAGFQDVETHTETHTFVLPSFDAYYGPLNAAGLPRVKHWRHCPTKYAELCARRCGGTLAIGAAQLNP
jgi:hypothetical protein